MTAILCHLCKRPNGVSAKNCIWCRAQLAEGATVLEYGVNAIEADYLEGIARLDDPSPVRLIVTREGIEVVELVPGSRSIKIPASSIVEVSVTRSGFGERHTESPWWRSALGPLRLGSVRSNTTNEERGYRLAVQYRAGDEVHKGLFSCSQRDGRLVARKLMQQLERPAGERNHAEEDRRKHG